MRLAILPLVKFLSRLFTALNLLPPMARQSPLSVPTRRQSSTNCPETLQIPAVVSPEIRNGLVVWHQLAGRPHHLNVATSLALQPAD